MLDYKKIKTMTELALYESGPGKEDIKKGKYYKMDYVRYKTLETVLTTSLAYLLVLVMIFIYKSEYLIKEAINLDYKSIGTKILGIYCIILILYVVGALIFYPIQYDRSRIENTKYVKKLKTLEDDYREEI